MPLALLAALALGALYLRNRQMPTSELGPSAGPLPPELFAGGEPPAAVPGTVATRAPVRVAASNPLVSKLEQAAAKFGINQVRGLLTAPAAGAPGAVDEAANLAVDPALDTTAPDATILQPEFPSGPDGGGLDANVGTGAGAPGFL